MGDNFPRWSARNPLGIIALFISLIYGMSALLLGTSVDSLAASNQTVLVAFVVTFPFVVLGVFAWFVAKHHKKLYGPADFRSDEAFHAVQDLPPAALGRRLSQETEATEVEPIKPMLPSHDDGREADASTELETEKRQHELGIGVPRSVADQVTRAFIAEALVFQELQREFAGAIRREVSIPLRGGRRFQADGVLRVDDKTIVVEVKFIRKSTSFSLRLRQAISEMMRYRNEIPPSASISFLLAIVYDFDVTTHAIYGVIEREQSILGENAIELRLFSFRDLMKKYGLPNSEEAISSSTAEDPEGAGRHPKLCVARERNGAR